MHEHRQTEQIKMIVSDTSRIAEALERIAQALSRPKNDSIHNERVAALRRQSRAVDLINAYVRQIEDMSGIEIPVGLRENLIQMLVEIKDTLLNN